MKRILLVALNMPHEYSLALYYLKLYALKDPDIQSNAKIDILEVKLTKSTWKMLFKILKKRPHLVAFSCNIWNINRTLKLAKIVKMLTRAQIVFGGQEVTHSYIEYLKIYPFIDIIVDGEGEQTFSDLLHDFLKTRFSRLDKIPGIKWRDNSQIRKNPPRPLIKDLDTIPSPYLNGMINVRNSHHLGMMVELTRGCFHKCRFCFEGSRYKTARSFSIKRVQKEIEFMTKKGIRKFHFLDPIIGNANIKRLKQIDNIVKNLFGNSEYYFIPIEVYAEYINEQNVAYLRRFSAFDIGLQSINPMVQKNIDRNFNPKKFLEGFRLLKQLKKETNIYIIIGLPGDNYFSLMKSVKFVVDCKPTFLYTNYLYILNGSYLREDIDRFDIKFHPKAPYAVISNNTFSERELKIARILAESTMKEYNLTLRLYKKVIS